MGLRSTTLRLGSLLRSVARGALAFAAPFLTGGGSSPPAAPVFTAAPSISPSSGNVGNVFIGMTGVVTGGEIISQRWLLDGVPISTATIVVPEAAGSLVYEQTATGPGGTTVATSAAVTVSAVPLDVLYSATSNSATAASTSNTLSWNHTVTQGANRKLLVAIELPANETVTGVTYGGVALTLACGNTVNDHGASYLMNVSLWYLDSPTVGTAAVVATRSGTTAARWYGTASTLYDVASGAPAVTQTSFSATDGQTYIPTLPVATAAD